MYYGKQQQEWLAIAEKCLPTLNRQIRHPVAIVKAVEDASAFQNRRAETVGSIDAFFRQSFYEGDAFVMDFGEHLVGYLQFDLLLDGKAMGGPLRLKLTFAEVPSEFAEPFDPYRGSLSRAWLQDEIITIDQLPQHIRLPRRYAFQYLKIEILACSFDYRIRFSDFSGESVTSAPQPIELFQSKKIPAELQTIDRVALRTLRNCMQTVLEDGPKRDRRLWLADSPLMAQAIYLTFRNYDIYKRCLHLFAGLAHDDGRIPACVYERPSPHKGDEFILDFAIMFGGYLHEYAEHSGDWETARRLWPVAKKQLDFALEYLDKSGMFQDQKKWWLFIDWQPELDKQAPMQGLFIYAFKRIAALAKALSLENEVSGLDAQIEKMTVAAHQLRSKKYPFCFLSGKGKQLSWASQVWMILGGVVDSEAGAEILAHVTADESAIKPATPFIYHYTAEAMFKCGMNAAAIRLIGDYWGKMAALGASTFWEIFDPQDHFKSPYGDHRMNSYCHSWSCTPVYLLRKYLVAKS